LAGETFEGRYGDGRSEKKAKHCWYSIGIPSILKTNGIEKSLPVSGIAGIVDVNLKKRRPERNEEINMNGENERRGGGESGGVDENGGRTCSGGG
jgi:hypothetical protein